MYTCSNELCISKSQNRIKKDFFTSLLELFIEDRRWIHANPTSYNYYANQDSNPYDDYIIKNNILNNYTYILFDNIKQNNKGIIYIKGKRGSGKTTFLNYFINTQTRKLNQELNKTWLRIDATKIYSSYLNEKYQKLTFEEYLYGQLLFVIARYGRKNTQISYKNYKTDNIDNIDISNSDNYDQILHKIYNTYKDNDTFKEACKLAQSANNFSNSLDYKPFQYFELGKEILTKFKDSLIIFVDSIDNINYSTFLSKNVLNDLSDFLNNHSSQMLFVISLRNEYFLKLSKMRYEHVASDYEIKINTIDISPTITLREFLSNVKKVIEKLGNDSNYSEQQYETFKEKLLKLYNKHLQMNIPSAHELEKIELYYSFSLINEIKSYGFEFINEIAKAIYYLQSNSNKYSKIYKDLLDTENSNFYLNYLDTLSSVYNIKNDEQQIDKDICRDLYNSDFREYLLNYFKTYEYVLYNINKSSKASANNQRLIFHAIIKNGNLYTPGEDILENVPFRNSNFLNLFNILRYKRSTLSYLLHIYLLKYLEVKQEDSFENITKIFSVTKDIAQDIFNKYTEFGYIEQFNEEDMNSYKLTKKGKFILNSFFNYTDQLHSCIYMGLISADLSPYIKRYDDNFSNFIESTLINISILMFDINRQYNLIQNNYPNIKTLFRLEELITSNLKNELNSFEKKYREITNNTNIVTLLRQRLSNKNCPYNLQQDIIAFIETNLYDTQLPSFDQLYEKRNSYSEEERIATLFYFFNKTSYDILTNSDYQLLAFQTTFSQLANRDLYEEKRNKVDKAIENYSSNIKKQELRNKIIKIHSKYRNKATNEPFRDRFDDYLEILKSLKSKNK